MSTKNFIAIHILGQGTRLKTLFEQVLYSSISTMFARKSLLITCEEALYFYFFFRMFPQEQQKCEIQRCAPQ